MQRSRIKYKMLPENCPFTSNDPTRIATHALPIVTNLENDFFGYLKSKLVGEPAEGSKNIQSLISGTPGGLKQRTLALQRLDKRYGHLTIITATTQENLQVL